MTRWTSSSTRRAAIVLAAGAALLGACSGGDTSDESESAETSVAATENEAGTDTEPTEEDPSEGQDDGEPAGGEAAPAGPREAGFGPGSLAVPAGAYLDRLYDVDGNWFVGEPYEYREPPAVCGFEEPSAVQGLTLVQIDQDLAPLGDVMNLDVSVFDTAAQAERMVAVLNSATAADCDRALLAAVDSDLGTPGVELDFGDGAGTETEVPAGVPEGLPVAARLYEASARIGTLDTPLIQLETWVADGRFLLRSSATNISGEPGEVAANMLEAMFASPAPEISEDGTLDDAAAIIRGAALADSDLPDFYQPTEGLWFPSPSDEVSPCRSTDGLRVTSEGPKWIAISPGTGASEVRQGAAVYEDEALAAAAFDRLIDGGVDCLLDDLGLTDNFVLTDMSFEAVEVDGVTVAVTQLDLDQFLGGQPFAVEIQAVEALAGNAVHVVGFFGLAGDSPDLTELVVTAINKAEAGG